MKMRHKMNKQELHKYIEDSRKSESNICQISAMKDRKFVFDDVWHDFKISDAVNVMSVTKGIMGLLTGIAIDKGYIPDVSRKVIDYFPGYTVKRGEKTIYDVEIKHLLTMTAPYKYRSEPWTKICTSEDWTRTTLDFLGGRAGITGEFKYATLGIQILTGVLEQATGMRCIDFANAYLFRPLGIPDVAEHGASDKDDQLNYIMNKAPRMREWYTDPKGAVMAGWGICLSAQDLAKMGEMVLHDGVYEGKRVISEAYIQDMLTPHLKLGRNFANMYYGYLWYKPFEDREVYAAIGAGGNVIYVNKEKNISVGVTGTFKPMIFDRVEFIETKVIPMLMSV